jgi:hypothetical protein
MPYATVDYGVRVETKDSDGLALTGTVPSVAGLPATANVYAVGCLLVALDTGDRCYNEGTSAVPNWVIN